MNSDLQSTGEGGSSVPTQEQAPDEIDPHRTRALT